MARPHPRKQSPRRRTTRATSGSPHGQFARGRSRPGPVRFMYQALRAPNIVAHRGQTCRRSRACCWRATALIDLRLAAGDRRRSDHPDRRGRRRAVATRLAVFSQPLRRSHHVRGGPTLPGMITHKRRIPRRARRAETPKPPHRRDRRGFADSGSDLDRRRSAPRSTPRAATAIITEGLINYFDHGPTMLGMWRRFAECAAPISAQPVTSPDLLLARKATMVRSSPASSGCCRRLCAGKVHMHFDTVEQARGRALRRPDLSASSSIQRDFAFELPDLEPAGAAACAHRRGKWRSCRCNKLRHDSGRRLRYRSEVNEDARVGGW